ncbi:uncharacterized protein LOC123531018 isoform X1 [Mercenaria mercenaria]|uniref:uncharacterized protein LOC123531018 isoform X1 n=1 Tax=Mercenaria mercenaria TaxID=6596 RepID=UPI00234EC714|nr:uncharacterized protein LOC123531018 isoform X1 [Mercenaria mercenaria]
MPSRKRSVASSNGGAKRKRAVSHTATTTSATNDEAIIALSENTRYRNSRRSTVTTPNIPIPVPVTESVSIQTQHIVDTLTDKLEAIVENKIQQVLGQSGQARPQQVQAPETVPTQQLQQQQQQQAESLDDRAQSVFTGNSGCLTSASLQSSPSIPLHASVNLKIKEKIWADEFVDFSTSFSKSQESFSLTITPTGISSFSQSNSRKFITIEQWTDIFAVFSSVYRQKYPDTAEQLAQYSNTVRAIAKARGNWHYYDVQFRQLRQSHPFSWDSIHHELYIKALSQKQPFRPNGPQTGQSRKTCNKFNRGDRCTGCIYQHKCKTCSGNHPHYKCWKRTSDGAPKNSNNAVSHNPTGQTPQTKPIDKVTLPTPV